MKAERDKLVDRDTRIAIWNALKVEKIGDATCHRIIGSLAPGIETLIDCARQEAREDARNPCDRIFDHKWLDLLCVLEGCQSLRLEHALDLLRGLTFAARTSGGTAGPDQHLMDACDKAEDLLVSIRALGSHSNG